MRALLDFLQYYRSLLVFISLQLLCFVLLSSNHSSYRSWLGRVLDESSARTLYVSNNLREFFRLKHISGQLAEENARLSYQLYKQRQLLDEFKLREYASYDTTLQSEYEFIPAKVVRNSTHRSNNYLTINKGSADGIRPGMGVISPKGIVGKVEMCSEHFATISSLLHSRTWVSAAIKNTNNIGSVKWEGNSPLYAKLMHMPSHYKIQVGDTVLTSGHNAVFPPDLPIGVIHKLEVKPNETFHDVDLRLSTDFNTLTYVYVIKYLRKSEQDSLEQATVEYLDNVR